MNENAKTGIFIGVAVLVAVVAWLSGPSFKTRKATNVVGQPLCKEFDPLSATRLEIMRFNEKDRECVPFEVAQVNGRWSIPSHSNYPADAKDHLADAATSLMGLKIVGFKVECDPMDAFGTYYMYLDDLRVTSDLFEAEARDPDDMYDNW